MERHVSPIFPPSSELQNCQRFVGEMPVLSASWDAVGISRAESQRHAGRSSKTSATRHALAVGVPSAGGSAGASLLHARHQHGRGVLRAGRSCRLAVARCSFGAPTRHDRPTGTGTLTVPGSRLRCRGGLALRSARRFDTGWPALRHCRSLQASPSLAVLNDCTLSSRPERGQWLLLSLRG
jgi:hypothetical protein